MRDIYRDLNLPIDTNTLSSLEGLDRSDIVNAFRLVTSTHGITRSINRLHNDQKRRAGKIIKAHQLVNQGFEVMAEIEICLPDGEMVLGRITNAVDIGNADTIGVTVLQKHHQGGERTWLIGRDNELRIWKKEVRGMSGTMVQPGPNYDKVVDHGFLRASYIAENLSTFFGKRMSVKNVGTGVLRRIEVKDHDPDVFHLDLGIVRNVAVHKDALVQVHKTLEPRAYREVKAQTIKSSPNEYLGCRVVFDDDRVDGRLAQVSVISTTPQSVNFLVNGETTKLHIGELVKVYPREKPGLVRQGRYPWATDPGLVPPPSGRNQADDLANQARAAYGRYLGRLGLVVPDDRPDYQGDSWWYFNNNTFIGKTVQLGSGDPAKSGVKGVCTQVAYENGKLVFVIDGLIYKRNRHTTLKVWNKKENN